MYGIIVFPLDLLMFLIDIDKNIISISGEASPHSKNVIDACVTASWIHI